MPRQLQEKQYRELKRRRFDIRDTGPMTDPIDQMLVGREAEIARHAELRRQEPFASHTKRLSRLTMGFYFAVNAMWLMSTRGRQIFDEFLTFRLADDQLQSSVAILSLAREGQLTAARRELRYMLEAGTKHVYVDLREMGKPFANKLSYLEAEVPRSSVSFVDDFRLCQFTDDENKAFMDDVRRTYAELCKYVHRSPQQIQETLLQFERGIFLGFETADQLEAFVRLLARVYDLLLVMHFNALGMALTGDVFVRVLDSDAKWPFHKTKFVRLLSGYFDYKFERQKR